MDSTPLVSVDPASLPDAALEDAVVATYALGDVVRAQAVALLAEVGRRGTWEVSGCRSQAAWLVGVAPSLSRSAAGAEVRLAAFTSALPKVAEAVGSGEMTTAHAGVLVGARNPRTAEAMARDEALLVGLASQLTVDEFVAAVRHWKLHADPQGPAPDDPAHNRLSIVPVGGRWRLSGDLDADSGAVLHRAVEEQVGRRYRAEGADERSATTSAVRGTAALLDLVRAGAERPAHGPCGSRPSMTVVVPFDELSSESQQALLELPDGGTIGAGVLRMLSCDATVARVVLGPEGQPLDAGRSLRLPSPAQRRAVLARDGGCAVEGCGAPPWLCEIHHLIHWIDDGPTAIENLAMTCRWHHRKAHTKGWHLGRDPDGVIRCRPDDHRACTPAA